MIKFLENTIFNKKRRIIKSMDYKYTETQADLAKLKSAMEFIRKHTSGQHLGGSYDRGKDESQLTFAEIRETQES
jgi:hypothetical protein